MSTYSFIYMIAYLSIGAFSGFISGLLGLGGGVIVVPALAFVFTQVGVEQPMHFAIGTSLAVMVLTTFSSARAHYKRGSVRIDIWRKWIGGLVVGAMVGAFVATRLPSHSLKMIFAVFLLFITIKLVMGSRLPSVKLKDSWYILLPIGFFMGVFSGMLGVGGGVMMVPLLLALGSRMNEAAGTAAISSLPLAIFGAITYSVLGYSGHNVIPLSVGYVYLPGFIGVGLLGILFAPLGASVGHKMPSQRLKCIFSLVLFVICVQMFLP